MTKRIIPTSERYNRRLFDLRISGGPKPVNQSNYMLNELIKSASKGDASNVSKILTIIAHEFYPLSILA